MESLILSKKSGSTTWWSIDVTTMPIQKVLELIISETGSDYRVKRTPDKVILECLDRMKDKLIEGGAE